ncbi:MAG TPA: chromate transporter, partial [Acidimicrobiales bacterium]|nr:chromate transporter [Acidimicrobiales bacterium]
MFLRLGVTAVGGPAAHVAMMHDEVVRRRGWVTDARFVDLVGATNLVPGPNSTELAIHLGWERARGRGLAIAGICFIAPAAVIVGVLAWVYVTYGDTPALGGLLYGMKPVAIAIVVHALVRLLPVAARTPLLVAVAASAAVLLLDAVSIGQVTPGPVFTTATFIGYLVAGAGGALVATVGIFLPSFGFVALLTKVVDRMRASAGFGAVLDGVNAASVGLMAGVSAQLAGDALVDPITVAVLVVSGLLLWRTKLSSTWLIGGWSRRRSRPRLPELSDRPRHYVGRSLGSPRTSTACSRLM